MCRTLETCLCCHSFHGPSDTIAWPFSMRCSEEIPFAVQLEIKEMVSDFAEIVAVLILCTDRTTLVTITESLEDFLDRFADKLVELTRHHFTAKAQSQYLQVVRCKTSLKTIFSFMAGTHSDENHCSGINSGNQYSGNPQKHHFWQS